MPASRRSRLRATVPCGTPAANALMVDSRQPDWVQLVSKMASERHKVTITHLVPRSAAKAHRLFIASGYAPTGVDYVARTEVMRAIFV